MYLEKNLGKEQKSGILNLLSCLKFETQNCVVLSETIILQKYLSRYKIIRTLRIYYILVGYVKRSMRVGIVKEPKNTPLVTLEVYS